MTDENVPEREMDDRLRREGQALRETREGCPDPDLLMARGSEVLDEPLRQRLDEHVRTCDACRRLNDDLDRLDLAEADGEVAERVRDRVRADSERRRLGALVPIAAALALACGLALQSFFDRVPQGAGTTAVAVATPDRQPVPTGEHAALWDVSAPPLRLPLSSLDPARGTATDTAPSFVAAVRPYQAGDYHQAGERFAEIAKAFPSSADAHFYLGVSRLLAGQPHDAIASLTAARALLPESRGREVEWYLAAARQRAGDHAAAGKSLDALCGGDGPYREEACGARTRLR